VPPGLSTVGLSTTSGSREVQACRTARVQNSQRRGRGGVRMRFPVDDVLPEVLAALAARAEGRA
jgi:hypothetical protein